ncbi:MAG: hypothetical protein AAF074_16080 [Pseudomonadota bacterium]
MTPLRALLGLATLPVVMLASAAADISDEANACIDYLRTEIGDVGGEVVDEEFSEAAIMVRLRASDGREYECLVWSGPEIAEFRESTGESGFADDGGGAMAGAAPRQDRIVVRFAPGTTGATYTDSLGSSDAVRYVLGARKEQFLTVDLRGNSAFLNYIIYVPGGDILFESTQGGYQYEGQLYKSGDHTVEVFYNGEPGTFGDYDLIFQIN